MPNIKRTNWSALFAEVRAPVRALQKRLAAIVEAIPQDELPMSGLPDLVLKFANFAKDAALAESRLRKERFELSDLKAKRQTDEGLIANLRAQLDALKDADQTVSQIEQSAGSPGMTPGGPEEPAMDPPNETENVPPASRGAPSEDTDLGPENDS